jgi:hypothetical protein
MNESIRRYSEGLLDLSQVPSSQLELLIEEAPVNATLASSLRRVVWEVIHPSDIVIAKFDSSI